MSSHLGQDLGDLVKRGATWTAIAIPILWLICQTAKLEKRFSSTRRQKLRAADYINDGKHHLLLCATGSVATIKIPQIVKALSRYDNLSIRIILTKSAAEFLQGQAEEQPRISKLDSYKNVAGVYFDEDEWANPWRRNDSILHIELRRWADMMVVAPLSANSLAKLALGLSDDLFSCVARAWDTTGLIDPPRSGFETVDGKKIIIVAPAMNTAMWEHPVTAQHISRLEGEWGLDNGGWISVMRPKEGNLACGDVGSGAMKDWQLIVKAIEMKMSLSAPMLDGQAV